MGVEYVHYLVPKGNSFLPSSEELLKFIHFLHDEKWVYKNLSSPPCLKFYGEDKKIEYPLSLDQVKQWMKEDFVLSWYGEDFSGENVRFVFEPEDQFCVGLKDMYYDLQIHFSQDYIFNTSDCLEGKDIFCSSCGEQLDFESDDEKGDPFFLAQKIHYKCFSCGKVYNPSNESFEMIDGFSGPPQNIVGGATYRFGIKIDCGKSTPDGRVMLKEEFILACQRILGVEFYPLGLWYC